MSRIVLRIVVRRPCRMMRILLIFLHNGSSGPLMLGGCNRSPIIWHERCSVDEGQLSAGDEGRWRGSVASENLLGNAKAEEVR